MSEVRYRKTMNGDDEREETDKHNLNTKNHLICRARLQRSASSSVIFLWFGIEALTGLQINFPTGAPDWLFTILSASVCASLCLSTLALAISNFVLPNHLYLTGADLEPIREYPDTEYARQYLELAWILTTVLGFLLFFVQGVALCWIKFYDDSLAACWVGTIVFALSAALFLYLCVYFHRQLITHNYRLRMGDLIEMADLADNKLQ